METITEFTALCNFIRSITSHNLIAVEGFSGSGKSHLAESLRSELLFPVIHTDEFVIGGDEAIPYPDRLDYNRLRSALDLGDKSSGVVLFDGICARESLRRLRISATHFIYVKRVETNGLWHDGFHLEDFQTEQAIFENNEEPFLSDLKYHVAERPHENADIIFERIEHNEPNSNVNLTHAPAND